MVAASSQSVAKKVIKRAPSDQGGYSGSWGWCSARTDPLINIQPGTGEIERLFELTGTISQCNGFASDYAEFLAIRTGNLRSNYSPLELTPNELSSFIRLDPHSTLQTFHGRSSNESLAEKFDETWRIWFTFAEKQDRDRVAWRETSPLLAPPFPVAWKREHVKEMIKSEQFRLFDTAV